MDLHLLNGSNRKVLINSLKPQMFLPILEIFCIFMDFKKDVFITSVNDGKHSRKSLHYTGNAIDIRTKHLKENELKEFHSRLKSSLTNDFDIVVEKNHLHIEYQPKYTE